MLAKSTDSPRWRTRSKTFRKLRRSKNNYGDDREAFNGLVPGCDNGNNSRRRPRYGIESHVALYRPARYTLLVNYMAADSDRVVPDCYSPAGDRHLGAVFLVAKLSPRCWVLVLFLGRYLRHDRLWGLGPAKRMATVRAGRGTDWHSDVRALNGIFLRNSEQKNS